MNLSYNYGCRGEVAECRLSGHHHDDVMVTSQWRHAGGRDVRCAVTRGDDHSRTAARDLRSDQHWCRLRHDQLT